MAVTIRNYRTELPGTIDADASRYEFPSIITKSNRGTDMTWKIYVCAEKDGVPLPIEDEWLSNTGMPKGIIALINVDTGYVGGKMRENKPTHVHEGKNIGKKNETNVFCQALRDAFGKYNKQMRTSRSSAEDDEGPIEEASSLFSPPMLSQVADMEKLVFPVAVQPKFNGLRAVAYLENGKPVIYSRTGKEYIVHEALKQAIHDTLTRSSYALDGELYAHGDALQEITSLVRGDHDKHGVIKYMVYDICAPDMKYSERMNKLKELLDSKEGRAAPSLVSVSTIIVNSRSELQEAYTSFLAQGYEGAMIRLLDRLYEPSYKGYHSSALLKMKPTLDAEFKIIGWSRAENGKAKGALMMECETADGIRFRVTPKKTLKERMVLADKMEEDYETLWAGKPLIVHFDEYSKDKVPLRARTELVIREWE